MSEVISDAPSGGEGEVATGTESAAPAKALSAREAIDRAFETLGSDEPNETDKAAAVLKNGAGADDELVGEHAKAKKEAADAIADQTDASERAKKGWETRRANEEKAAEEAKAAEQATKIAKEVVKEAAKGEKEAQPEAKAAPEPVKDSKYPDPPKWIPKQTAPDWEAVPETLREEIVKRSEAFDQGIAKYKADAEQFEPLKKYADMANEAKTTIPEVLDAYIAINKKLSTDLVGGLEDLVSRYGYNDENGKWQPYSLRQIAEYVLEQPEEEVRRNSESATLRSEIAELKSTIEDLRKGFTETRKAEETRRQSTTQEVVEKFARDNPRFDELVGDMEMFLASPKFQRSGDYAADLKTAYEKAERLNPAPSISPPAPDIPSPDPEVQTRKGSASISGAPGAGSNTLQKKPVPKTAGEAVSAAFAQLNL